jgi:hypothetical protein
MCEIDPEQARVRLRGVAHEIMVIGPDNGNKQIAHGVAEPRGPKQQERLESGRLRGTQFQNQDGDEDSEYAIR